MRAKSRRSGSLLPSVGQYVGAPVEIWRMCRGIVEAWRLRPFVFVRREPHEVCLAFQSPATRNGRLSCKKNSLYSSVVIVWRGGEYTAAIVMGRWERKTRTPALWILFVM
jgi:hypothetical protein